MSREFVYRKAAGLRTRPVEAAECLMVFSPSDPKIQWLDLGAWLIFELSDGRAASEIEQAYFEAMGGENEDSRHRLHAGLEALLRSNLIERHATSSNGGVV